MGTYTMIRMDSCQVISVGSCSAAGDLEMMNARLRLKDDTVTGGSPTICEFGLETICDADEILIESTKGNSFVPVE